MTKEALLKALIQALKHRRDCLAYIPKKWTTQHNSHSRRRWRMAAERSRN